MCLHHIHDGIDIAVHRVLLRQLWLHLVQPLQQCLQRILELSTVQERLLQLALTIHGFAAHQVPFVFEIRQHAVHGLGVGGVALLSQGAAGTHDGVVHGLLGTEGSLEFLYEDYRDH